VTKGFPVVDVAVIGGGAVVSNAASNAKNLVGLVFVSAFVPDEGGALGAVAQGSKDSVPGTVLKPLTYPTGQGTVTATEFVLDPAHLREGRY
jgi:hypothetical protein